MERQDQQQHSASHDEPPSSDGLPRIDIVGLGPAGADLITAGTLALIDEMNIALCGRNAIQLRRWPGQHRLIITTNRWTSSRLSTSGSSPTW